MLSCKLTLRLYQQHNVYYSFSSLSLRSDLLNEDMLLVPYNSVRLQNVASLLQPVPYWSFDCSGLAAMRSVSLSKSGNRFKLACCVIAEPAATSVRRCYWATLRIGECTWQMLSLECILAVTRLCTHATYIIAQFCSDALLCCHYNWRSVLKRVSWYAWLYTRSTGFEAGGRLWSQSSCVSGRNIFTTLS